MENADALGRQGFFMLLFLPFKFVFFCLEYKILESANE